MPTAAERVRLVREAYASEEGQRTGTTYVAPHAAAGSPAGGQFTSTNKSSSKPAAKPAAKAASKPAAKPQQQAAPPPLALNAATQSYPEFGTLSERTAAGDPRISAVQTLMRSLGMNVEASGKFDKAMSAKVKELQLKLGMSPTGRVTSSLMKTLQKAAILSPCVRESRIWSAADLVRSVREGRVDQPRAPRGTGIGGRWVKMGAVVSALRGAGHADAAKALQFNPPGSRRKSSRWSPSEREIKSHARAVGERDQVRDQIRRRDEDLAAPQFAGGRMSDPATRRQTRMERDEYARRLAELEPKVAAGERNRALNPEAYEDLESPRGGAAPAPVVAGNVKAPAKKAAPSRADLLVANDVALLARIGDDRGMRAFLQKQTPSRVLMAGDALGVDLSGLDHDAAVDRLTTQAMLTKPSPPEVGRDPATLLAERVSSATSKDEILAALAAAKGSQLRQVARETGIAIPPRMGEDALREHIAQSLSSFGMGDPRGDSGVRATTSANGLSLDPATRAAQVDDRVRAAYSAVRARTGNSGGWVGMADLRNELGESLNRHEVDASLKRLEQQPGVNIIPESNQKTLTRADRDAAVVIGDQKKHAITIADDDNSDMAAEMQAELDGDGDDYEGEPPLSPTKTAPRGSSQALVGRISPDRRAAVQQVLDGTAVSGSRSRDIGVGYSSVVKEDLYADTPAKQAKLLRSNAIGLRRLADQRLRNSAETPGAAKRNHQAHVDAVLMDRLADRLEATPKPAKKTAAAKVAAAKKAQVPAAEHAAALQQFTTSAEAEAYLDANPMTVAQLKELARELGPTVDGKAGTKPRLRQAIIDGSVGYRERAEILAGPGGLALLRGEMSVSAAAAPAKKSAAAKVARAKAAAEVGEATIAKLRAATSRRANGETSVPAKKTAAARVKAARASQAPIDEMSERDLLAEDAQIKGTPKTARQIAVRAEADAIRANKAAPGSAGSVAAQPASTDEVEAAIRQAYDALARRPNAIVSQAEIEAMLGGRYSREDLDAGLAQLNRRPGALARGGEVGIGAGVPGPTRSGPIELDLSTTGTRGTRPTGEPPRSPEYGREVEDAVKKVYSEVARRPGVPVRLSDLRERLGNRYPRADVDNALLRLNRTPNANIVPESDQLALTPKDRAAGLIIGNQDKHNIAIY